MSDNYELNSVLCYVCSSRNSLDKEIIISSVFNFYSQLEICEAKNLICSYAKVDPRRRTGEGKSIRDISDILDILKEIDDKTIEIPTFVTKRWNSLPPPNTEFGPLSRNVTHLSEIIYNLNRDLNKIKDDSEGTKNFEEHILEIKEDIADIKKSQMIQHRDASSMKNNFVVLSKNMSSGDSENHMFLNKPPVIAKIPTPIMTNSSYATRAASPPVFPLVLSNNPRRTKRLSASPVIDAEQLSEEALLPPSRKDLDKGWTLVDSKKKRKNYINNSIIGSGTFNSENGFSSAPRTLDLFIGGCGLNTKPEEIIDFCKKNHNIEVKIMDMNSKSEFRKSFKVTVDGNSRDMLLDTKMWPQGVIVRKFTNRRNNSTFGNSK